MLAGPRHVYLPTVRQRDLTMHGMAFELVAHRGFSAARPENTIAAFTHALDQA